MSDLESFEDLKKNEDDERRNKRILNYATLVLLFSLFLSFHSSILGAIALFILFGFIALFGKWAKILVDIVLAMILIIVFPLYFILFFAIVVIALLSMIYIGNRHEEKEKEIKAKKEERKSNKEFAKMKMEHEEVERKRMKFESEREALRKNKEMMKNLKADLTKLKELKEEANDFSVFLPKHYFYGFWADKSEYKNFVAEKHFDDLSYKINSIEDEIYSKYYPQPDLETERSKDEKILHEFSDIYNKIKTTKTEITYYGKTEIKAFKGKRIKVIDSTYKLDKENVPHYIQILGLVKIGGNFDDKEMSIFDVNDLDVVKCENGKLKESTERIPINSIITFEYENQKFHIVANAEEYLNGNGIESNETSAKDNKSKPFVVFDDFKESVIDVGFMADVEEMKKDIEFKEKDKKLKKKETKIKYVKRKEKVEEEEPIYLNDEDDENDKD